VIYSPEHIDLWLEFQDDWNKFARDYLRIKLDPEQEEALYAVQVNPKVAIASGTSRGKDYVTAAAAVCFMYLTPVWNEKGELVGNTKVILSAPTGRQVKKIMMPEVSRIFRGSIYLPGTITSDTIRIPGYDEWYLHAFKADDTNIESWTGFHAVNMFFGITEATGLPQQGFDSIEGNLQGNSRLLIVFNPNISHGYAANAFRASSFKKIRLNSLNAPNVLARKIIYPGQVDYDWIKQRVEEWCTRIAKEDRIAAEGDFDWEGAWYRPNDLFRAKVLGLFPKASEGVLIPREWIDLANERYKQFKADKIPIEKQLRLGVDVAGMGRDSSCFLPRFGDLVEKITMVHSGGTANHMEIAGKTLDFLRSNYDAYSGRHPQAFIDTIGEGAGVYSRLIELSEKPNHDFLKGRVHSAKFSEAAESGGTPLKDHTQQYEFANLRAYLFWAIRDWLNPEMGSKAMLPPDEALGEELSEIKWKFQSNGKIIIEPKEEIKKRLKRSPDKADALANTFYPVPDISINPAAKKKVGQYFF
jgi:hypothetical protein